MSAARRRLARLIITAAVLTLLVGVADASAAKRQISATSIRSATATFDLDGVAPRAIRSARLRAGGVRRALALSTVRAAARRGMLRVRRVPARKPVLTLTLASVSIRSVAPDDGATPPTAGSPAAGQPGAGGAADGAKSGNAGAPAPGPASPGNGGAPAPGVAPSNPQASGPSVGPAAVAPERIPADARYVGAEGSDTNPGTAAAPWRSLAKAVASARPGDTVVVGPGSYGASGTTTNVGVSGTADAPITFIGDPAGDRPSLLGYVRIAGSHLRFANLLFDGPTGRVLPISAANPKGEEVKVSVMHGEDVEIRSSEVRGSAWHAGVYVYAATDVRLLANHIHDNGDRGAPSQANLDHGIYWHSGSGVVAQNLIEDNVAYGVHLYPTAAGVSVTRNTIVGNGKGGVIVADRASDNTIAANVIARNGLSGIKGYALTGQGNVATGNVLWANGSRDLDGSGIALSGNVSADPMFVGGGDYRVSAGGPAAGAGAGAFAAL